PRRALAALSELAPANVGGIGGLRDRVQRRGRIADDLRSLSDSPAASSLLERCAPIFVPNHRPVPILAYYLDRPPDEIVSAQLEPPTRGVFVAPATPEVKEKFVLDPRDPKRLAVPDRPGGFKPVGGNRSWTVYE